MKKALGIFFGRRAAVVWLALGVVWSIVLACRGAERSLADMKATGPMIALAALALVGALACLWSRRPCVWLLHMGLALVLGGWLYDAYEHREGRVPEDCMLWLSEPVSRGDTGWTFTMGDEQRGYYGHVWCLPGPAPTNAVGWEYVREWDSPHSGFMRWTTNMSSIARGGIPLDYLSADADGAEDMYPERTFGQTVVEWFNTSLQTNADWHPTRAEFRRLMNDLAVHVRSNGRVEKDGVALSLRDFRIQVWEDTGTIRSYESDVEFSDGRPGTTISVNHPLRMGDGWWIYQQSWDRALGRGFIWSLVNQQEHPGALPRYHMLAGKPCADRARQAAYWSDYANLYDQMAAEVDGRTGTDFSRSPRRPRCVTGLLCVKDVGLPWVFAGALLLVLGAVLYAVESFRAVRALRDEREQKVSPPVLAFFDRACSSYELRPCGRLVVMARALYLGCFLGCLAMLVHRGWTAGHAPMQNMYEFLMCTAALIPVLTLVSRKFDHQETLLIDSLLLVLVMVPVGFVMDGSVRKLMPALQSPFFVPHVGAYVLGYILLIRAALGAGRRLVGLGFFLLTLGLVLGAAWGKICWGHWWQFDPKEMWSAATWFTYAAYFHLRARLSPRVDRWFLIVGAVMIVLTLTWVNLSRIFPGMHSYA